MISKFTQYPIRGSNPHTALQILAAYHMTVKANIWANVHIYTIFITSTPPLPQTHLEFHLPSTQLDFHNLLAPPPFNFLFPSPNGCFHNPPFLP